MTRRGVSDERKRAATIQGSVREIARGGRPSIRVICDSDERWAIYAMPWLPIEASTRSEAVAAARAALAAELDVSPVSFDVEAG